MPDFESEKAILGNQKPSDLSSLKKVSEGAEGAVETTPSAAIP
tara:strand:- start:444 stop:572 length:129 start_codon:yes stop_codon:yes gene_type:complete